MSTISGTITHSITLATTGIYASPLTIAATGSVSNNGTGDAIYGPATNAWTVTNLGRVSATGSYAGIDLRAGGSVTNGSTGDTTSLVAGGSGTGGFNGGNGTDGSTAISGLSGIGSIVNWGTIAGGVGGDGGVTDVETGANGGTGGSGISLSRSGSITNWGTIFGGAGGVGGVGARLGGSGGAGGSGISLSSGGSIGNWGAIEGGAGGNGGGGTEHGYSGGNGGAGGIGIGLSSSGSIGNFGTITGGAGGNGHPSDFKYAPGNGGAGGGGIYLSDGSIANGSSSDKAALIQGGAGGNGYMGVGGGDGINLVGAGGIINWGTIAGGAGGNGGSSYYNGFGGGVGGCAIRRNSGSLSNYGTIVGGAGGNGGGGKYGATGGFGGFGVRFFGDGSIGNWGIIAGGAGGNGGAGYFARPGGGGAGRAGVALSQGGSIGNYGTIVGGAGGVGAGASHFHPPAGHGSTGAGVYIGGGFVTNGKAGHSAALIEGGIGIVAYGGAATTRVTNSGTIAGSTGSTGAAGDSVTPKGGTGGAGGVGIVFESSGGGIANSGLIAGGAGGAGGDATKVGATVGGNGGTGGTGIILSDAIGIGNSGTIKGGAGGAGGHGNQSDGQAGAAGPAIVVENGGTVTNGSARSGAALIAGSIGLQALGKAGVTVTNFGTIEGTGGIAVAIGNGAAGKVIVEPGAVFLGKVLGGGNSEIEFAAAGVAGMSNVSGFATIGLLNGHSHSLSLTDANFAAVSGRVITVNGGNAGDTVDAAALPAADRIIVHAGTGNDQLTGGAGNDTFEFSAANLQSTDVVKGGLGTDRLVMMSAGAVAAAGVSGVETYSLSDGGASSLLLTNANFAGVSGTTITVEGGNPGKTVNAATVTGSNRVILIGGFGADSFTGGAGNDVFQFAAANLTAADTVQGRSGSDQLRMTSAGTVAAFGVSGVETYSLASGGANSLTLTDANFDGVSGAAITVDGGNGGNTVNASALTGSNRVIVVGGAGKDIFTGGAGNDVFRFTVANLAASDTVKGGVGSDQLVMTTAGTIAAGGVAGVETYVLANGGANSLTLVNGNFSGVTGSTITVDGGNGGNTVDASALSGANRVIVTGGAGNDTFKFSAASLKSTDVVKGGLGTDRLGMTSPGAVAAAGVSGVETYSLSDGGASSLLLTNANFAGVSGTTITVEGGNPGKTVNAATVTGSNRVVLIGGFGADSFTGGAGNDVFQFAAANLTAADTVQGRSGSDQLRMTSAGTVAAFGVSGVETFTLASGGANSLTLTDANFDGVSGAAITVDGGNGGNTLNASALTGSNRVIVVGGAGKDIFTGGAGNDIFHFTVANLAASDTVKGGAGSDQLVMTTAGTIAAGGVAGVETYALTNGGANSLTLVNGNFSGVTRSTITVDGGNAGNMVDASALTGANRVIVTGGAGNDTFKFSAASLKSTDVVKGGLGTDRLGMTSPGTVLAGGVSGVETFQLAGGGVNSLTLADANFAGVTGTTITVDGGNAGNTLKAGALTSPNRVIVTGGGGADALTGGAGNDIFEFSAANLQSTDVVKGGFGADRLVMMSAGAVAASGVSGVETYSLSDGGASSLLLTNANFAGVSGAAITVDGGNPGKTVNAATVTGSNRVVLIGGFGADSFTGGAGNDVFQFAAANLTAADTVQGRSGSDQLRMTSAGTVAAFGVSGVETYSLANGGANSLTLTDANFDGVSGATITVDGGNGGNTVNASALTGSNRVVVVGGAGKDIFTGGAGNDVFRFTVANLAASDTVKGGAGSDQLVMTTAGTIAAGGVAGVETYVLANGGANSLTLASGNFAGLAAGAPITVSDGNKGTTLTASTLPAGDHIVVHAGTGADALKGGTGNDVFYAGGKTAMTGGAGADGFAFSAPGSNTIADFTPAAGDQIAFGNAGFALGLSGATATPKPLPAALFTKNATGAFTATTQRFAYDTANGNLFYSAAGTTATEKLVVTLTGHPDPTGHLFFIS